VLIFAFFYAFSYFLLHPYGHVFHISKMPLGKQIILELYQCNAKKLSNPQFIEEVMQQAATAMGATIVTSAFHHFAPNGVSGVVVIQESHLTIHTWPEHHYAAIDIFTCGDIEIQAGVAHLVEVFEAREQSEQILERGFLGKFRK
jgi:S-adenosylmethionine decarboxylase proenzyme